MNVRPTAETLRPQQSMPHLAQVPMNPPPHFLPPHQQSGQHHQPPTHMGLMQNPTNPSMAMLGGGVQNNNSSALQMTATKYQLHQNAMLQGQNPQMNASAAAANASRGPPLGHNPLQGMGGMGGMGFPANMMQQGVNGVPVRRVQSHPQGLNQAGGHVSGMHPGQQPVNGINMAMNPQVNMPPHIRQAAQPPMMGRMPGSMPGSMSPDLMGRPGNASGGPQNSIRAPSTQGQIMNSLTQPSGLPQGGLQQSISQNSFQPTVPGHPHHTPSLTSSSPRPSGHPQQQQQHAANLMMGQSGPSQSTGPRAMNHGDNAFVGLQNHQFPQNMVPGSNRIPNNASLSFLPPVSQQNDALEMPQSMSDGLPNSSNPSIRSSFQTTPAQQFEQLQQNDSFGTHFNLQSQGNQPPTRPPSHPPTAHGNSIPPRQMQPPQHHSPHQSDPMASHVQQQPQRPQSQPQGPPGRPPSQPGLSHTPRSSQSQLPPSSGHIPATRITPHTQTQSSPHQQRQSPSVQQPIAPRPPQGPASTPTNAASSEASTSQPSQPSGIPRNPHVMAMPVGLGQGVVRLLQFSGQLSSESPSKHQLSFWEKLVEMYFTPKAIMKVTLWKDNQTNEAKPFEIGVPILPRFFLVTTQSGVKSMTLSLDGAREDLLAPNHAIVKCPCAVWTYKYTNGYTVTLRGPLTVQVFLIPHTSTSTQQPGFTLKFDQFQFQADKHEKFISLDAISGNRIVESPKTPRVRSAPTPSPNGLSSSQRAEEERLWEEPRVLLDQAYIPGEPVNAFGIPQATMRCLELAESVSQMTDLIAFATDNKLGPMDALSELAKKLREVAHNPAANGAYMFPTGLGVFPGYGGPTSALYPGMPPSVVPAHSMPSGSSPQNAPPPSADTPQKQSKPPTSGPPPPAPNQPPAPSQAGLTSTPSMASASLKRKPNDTNSPTTSHGEPQSKRTRKPKRNG
ncbi:hypothetical protein HYDPIDRAFT_105367 [Hydnomerulius pinastri MD-312]|nr:hypothetical protein HYDPIDRAFT_105367 [Hydnomerulius pinastri MD-312]